MRCEEVRKTLPLFLYGELSFDEEEQVEVHMDECAGCRDALDREKLLFRSLDQAAVTPGPDLLRECRAGLRESLAQVQSQQVQPQQVQPQQESFWDKIRGGFTIHFHFAPGLAQVAGAAAMLALGFFGLA